MFDRLTNVIGRAVGIGRFLFVHILGDFQYANHRVGLRDQLVDLPLSFQDELYGYESLWVRSRLISLFGVNQPTGHCMQTILNFQIAAIAMDESKTGFQFFPFLVSDTRDGSIGDYGYDGEPALMFEKGLNSSIRVEITQSIVSLLMSDPDSLGVFFDYMACEYDGSIDTIECDGSNFRREYLGYLFPPHPDDLYHDGLDGWWPFKLPRAKRRQNNPMDTKRRIDRLDF